LDAEDYGVAVNEEILDALMQAGEESDDLVAAQKGTAKELPPRYYYLNKKTKQRIFVTKKMFEDEEYGKQGFEWDSDQESVADSTYEEYVSDALQAGLPQQAPAYSDQFRGIFNTLPGSQRFEAQSGIPAMFTDAETLFYLTEDWTAREGASREWLTDAMLQDPEAELSLRFDEKYRKEEEKVFADWVRNTYLQDPRGTRFGQGFYGEVRDLRKRMLAIKDISMEDLYETLTDGPMLQQREFHLVPPSQGKKTVMDRFVFMDPGAQSSNRLAQLVGMYNIHPGADQWLKTKMMKFYSGMMANWQASGRDSYDFIEAFVKDKPAMPGAIVAQSPED